MKDKKEATRSGKLEEIKMLEESEIIIILVDLMKEIEELKRIRSDYLNTIEEIMEENRNMKNTTKALSSRIEEMERDKRRNNILVSGLANDADEGKS